MILCWKHVLHIFWDVLIISHCKPFSDAFSTRAGWSTLHTPHLMCSPWRWDWGQVFTTPVLTFLVRDGVPDFFSKGHYWDVEMFFGHVITGCAPSLQGPSIMGMKIEWSTLKNLQEVIFRVPLVPHCYCSKQHVKNSAINYFAMVCFRVETCML